MTIQAGFATDTSDGTSCEGRRGGHGSRHLGSAIDKVVLRPRTHVTHVDIVGLNEARTLILDRLTIHDKPRAVLAVGH